MTVVVAAESVALLPDAVGDALVGVAGLGGAKRRMNIAKPRCPTTTLPRCSRSGQRPSQPGSIAKADWQFSLKLRGPWAWNISKVGVFDIFVARNWDAVAHHPNQQRVSFAASAHLTANTVRRHRWHVSLTATDCLTSIFALANCATSPSVRRISVDATLASKNLSRLCRPRFVPSRSRPGRRAALRQLPVLRFERRSKTKCAFHQAVACANGKPR